MFDIDKADRPIGMFIFDIYIASLKIREVANSFHDVQTLLYDFRSWDSVIREFEVIGEANRLLDENYRVVVDFRNLLIHNYFGIDPEEVWNIIKDDLPEFKSAIVNSIKSINNALKKQLIDSYVEMNKHLNFIVNELERLKG
jgi:uncharacterized protein with HEPN domain